MKKNLLFICSILGVLSASAQSIQFGIKAGVNLANQSNIMLDGKKDLLGFNAGGLIDIGFKGFSIQPGLIFSTKGYANTIPVSSIDGSSLGSHTFKTIYNYIEIPVNILYKTAVGPGKIYLGGGPYLAYALSAKSSELNERRTSSDLEITYNLFNYPEYKRIDYGINFMAGYQLTKGFTFNTGYELGVANLFSSYNSSNKNGVIYFSVGYFFK